MYKIVFTDVIDIRMGSPYYLATVNLVGTEGEFIPDLSKQTFYDKFANDLDRKIIYLVLWEGLGTEDYYFYILRISDSEKSLKRSKKIHGFCDNLILIKNGVKVICWRYKVGYKTFDITDFYNFVS